jgi:nitrogen regulatory protein PII
MKIVSVIIQPNSKTEFADFLKLSDLTSEFMFTHIEFHADNLGSEKASNHDLVVGYTPMIRADIFVESDKVDELVESLKPSSVISGKRICWVNETQNFKVL